MTTITFDDLFVTCENCQGKGKTVNSGGSGHNTWSREEFCLQCGGEGGKLTESGTAIKQFCQLLRQKGLL